MEPCPPLTSTTKALLHTAVVLATSSLVLLLDNVKLLHGQWSGVEPTCQREFFQNIGGLLGDCIGLSCWLWSTCYWQWSSGHILWNHLVATFTPVSLGTWLVVLPTLEPVRLVDPGVLPQPPVHVSITDITLCNYVSHTCSCWLQWPP